MTDDLHVDVSTLPEDVSAEVIGLAQLLNAHPHAKSALMRSIQLQQDARERELARTSINLDCPYCTAPGIPYLTLPTKNGPKVYSRRPANCCDLARRDAAERALYYAVNPNNDPAERIENADLYAALKDAITSPELLRELMTHELLLADIELRVGGLYRAQGGN